MNLAGIVIDPLTCCRVVAEISNNHNGDLQRAQRLIAAAAKAGADLIKFQAYTPDELVALRGDGPAPGIWGEQGWTMRRLYEQAQTPLAWFPQLAVYCEQVVGVPWFASVFGRESLNALEAAGCQAYKIAALDRSQADLIRDVHRTHRPVIISSPEPIGGNTPTLYCPPGYPTLPWQVRLPDRFGLDEDFLGLSSHCLDPRLPIAAVARGCKLIEMHVMLAEEPSALEASISLTEHQLRDMIQNIRATEAMTG